MTTLRDKILGSMVGGAAGDALGYPVEFISSFKSIASKYGDNGIRDYAMPDEASTDQKAQFSDDTQMTLYTAEGLLYAKEHGISLVPMICNAYIYWYGGQVGKKVKGAYPSELAKIDELNQLRAPGNTCLSALTSIHSGKEPLNNSKGCGGIMRIAPIALYGAAHGWTLEQTAKLAGEVAEITHLHQMSTLSSACCAAIIQLCALSDAPMTTERFSEIVAEAIECVGSLYPDFFCFPQFRDLINRSLRLRNSSDEDWRVIENDLGEGWVAEETLAIALFSVARHITSFEDCLVCAVNHGGDSDSTGAVAGNIIGAILGYDAIPEKYTNQLQLRELIESMSNKLMQ